MDRIKLSGLIVLLATSCYFIKIWFDNHSESIDTRLLTEGLLSKGDAMNKLNEILNNSQRSRLWIMLLEKEPKQKIFKIIAGKVGEPNNAVLLTKHQNKFTVHAVKDHDELSRFVEALEALQFEIV